MNATLPVVTPPTLRCKYFQVAGKHFLCIEGEVCYGADLTVVFFAVRKNFLSDLSLSHIVHV